MVTDLEAEEPAKETEKKGPDRQGAKGNRGALEW